MPCKFNATRWLLDEAEYQMDLYEITKLRAVESVLCFLTEGSYVDELTPKDTAAAIAEAKAWIASQPIKAAKGSA
jgi:hypothetical protein